MKAKSQESRIKSQEAVKGHEVVDNPHLNPELEGKYRIVGTHCPKVLNTSIGDIDFRTLTEAQAEQLVADGMPYIEKLFS